MTESKLDVDFVKDNLDTSGLLSQIAFGGVKALITTAIIIGAVVSVLRISELEEGIRFYVYTAVVTGAALAILLAAQFYYKKLFYLADIFYTNSIDSGENKIELGMRVITAVCIAVLFSIVVYISQWYPEIIYSVGGCSLVSIVFLYYVFRHKLTDLKAYLMYAGIGIATGTAAYLLGVLLIIAIGLIGLWLTVGILASETVFTAVYTYLGLLDWVNEEKNRQQNKQAWEEIHQQEAEAKEILNRMA
jgi:hypothetical protein